MNRIFRRMDKTSLLLYLYFKSFVHRRRISKEDGAVLVLADLLFGDLAMVGYLLVALHQTNPSRKIVVLSKSKLSHVVKLFEFVEVVAADHLSWRTLHLLRNASIGGYGEVINVFSWKWLPILNALDVGLLSSHLSKKSKDNRRIDRIAAMPTSPTSAPDIIFSLLHGEFNSTSKLLWKPVFIENEWGLPDSYLVIHIGASAAARLWPLWVLEKIIQLTEEKKCFVVFTGLNQDKTYTISLEKMIEKNLQSTSINLIGKTSLTGLLGVVSKAKGLISVDTGVIHWARFLSVPNLSVMGQSDSALFGANSLLFNQSYCVSTEKLDCQDKQTFHGIKFDWVAGCARNKCPLDDRLCFSNISQYDLESNFERLISG